MALDDLVIGIAGLMMAGKALGRAFDSTQQQVKTSMGQLRGTMNGKYMQVGDLPTATTRIHKVDSLEDRIKWIKKMVEKGVRDPTERAVLWQAVHQELGAMCGQDWCVKERDWMGELDAIYNFVRANVRYSHDVTGIDTYQSPLRTLQAHGGDCDCLTTLIAALCKMVGYSVKARVIKTTGSDDWNHVYCMVGLPPPRPTRWVAMDASVGKKAGWEAPKEMIAAKKDFPL